MCDVLDQIADAGCLWLQITGGEPFLRPDFLDIYTYAKQKGFLITLFTNGTMITPEIADYLAEWPPFSIEITLYGHTQETYERVTRIPGSHARCRRGVELILERNLPLKLKTVAITTNVHELWDMKAYAEGLGVSFHYDAEINARLDGSLGPTKYRLSPKEVVALQKADVGVEEDILKFYDQYGGTPPSPENIYQCGAGLSSFHVDPDGLLSLCLMSRAHSYDLRQGTFEEGWHDFLPDLRWQKRSRPSPCQSCSLGGGTCRLSL
jgi:radical SAM protein with 4Fe4S-binding SPASM domain